MGSIENHDKQQTQKMSSNTQGKNNIIITPRQGDVGFEEDLSTKKKKQKWYLIAKRSNKDLNEWRNKRK